MRFNLGTSSSGHRPLPQYKTCLNDLPSTRRSKAGRLAKCIVGGTALLAAAGLAAHYLVPSLDSLGYKTGQGPPPDKVLTTHQLQALQPGNRSISVGGDRRLRIFMPTDSPHINLCKSVMSAVALGYPAPILLNWGGEFNRPEWHLAGSHIAKLESLLSVIENMLSLAEGEDGDVHQDDLAVLVDAHDIWFQLPPSVLIQRYHQLNREADERVRQQWDDAQGFAADFPIQPPKQSILVTAAKDCHPKSDSGSDPHYAHWPESPMPSDMYGHGTDKVLTMPLDPARKFKKIRPRCVNSGMIMGTMGSLRNALTRAKAKVETVAHRGRQLWSDQALFGEVIGDQEMWREWVRELGSTWNGTASENYLSRLPADVRGIAKAALKGERFEYGIGLDYSFGTIPPTCSAEEDGYFVKMDDRQALKRESARAGVPNGEVRVNGVPAELDQAGVGSAHLSGIKWGDASLYTDFFFGVTPVGIHHNAYVDNLKSIRLKEWWRKMWFYPHLRNLVARALLPMDAGDTIRPLARIPAQEGGQVTRYWTPKSDLRNRMVKVFEPASLDAKSGGSFASIEWEGVCQRSGQKPWHEELFGDKKERTSPRRGARDEPPAARGPGPHRHAPHLPLPPAGHVHRAARGQRRLPPHLPDTLRLPAAPGAAGPAALPRRRHEPGAARVGPPGAAVLERMPGRSVDGLYARLPEPARRRLVNRLVDVLVELHAHAFPHVGGLQLVGGEGGEVVPGPLLEDTCWFLPDAEAEFGTDVPVGAPGAVGPYASHAEFVKGFVGAFVHAICVRERLGWVRDLVPRLAALAGALPRLRLDTRMVLAHKDLHFGNVMVDEDGELTAVLDWEFAGVVPVVRWDPVRAFLWNGVYSQEGHDEKYRMRAVFERELERRGVDKWWEATNADIDAVWDVVRYVRAIVELCPRGDNMDLCRVWRAKAEEALAKLGV
ncbi:Aminoglycoside phosphotransferase, partial [Metarhizium brunneum ARSEF 3297]